jgi:hypothetical protein
MKKQEQQNKEWEENYYPEMANEPTMPGDFFEQKIPSESCPGCRKRDELIKVQNELIAHIRVIPGHSVTLWIQKEIKLESEIEQLKNQL